MIEETIRKITEELKKQISSLKKDQKALLDSEVLLNLSNEEIRNKLAEYEIEDLDNLIDDIEQYRELLTISKYISKTTENNKNAIKKQIENINNKIKLQNQECQNKIAKLNNLLISFVSIYEYLFDENSNIDSEELFKYLEIIKSFPLRAGLLLEIVSEVCTKMLSESQELVAVDSTIEEQLNDEDNEDQIDEFESNLDDVTREIEETQEQVITSEPEVNLSDYRKQKISFATGMYSRFFSERSVDNLGFPVSYCEDSTPIEELENIAKEDGMSKLYFAIIFLKLILTIKDTSLTDDEIKQYSEKLDNYIKMYDESQIYIKELNRKIKDLNAYSEKLLELSKMGIYKEKFFEINQEMCKLNDYVVNTEDYLENNIIEAKDYERIENEIDNLSIQMEDFIIKITGERYIPIAEEQRIPISSFVLFARNPEDEPYILSDLFSRTQSLIDISAIGSSDRDYQNKISKLICDLFKYGAPQALASSNSNDSNNKGKIMEHVYYLDSKGKPDRDNPTDMWRFRPERNSIIRFAERAIVIPNDTKLFNQVVEIIKNVAPHFEIADEKKFSLIINVGMAIKAKDKDLYLKAIDRYDSIKIKLLELFFKDGKYQQKGSNNTPKLKTEFTPEEYKIFEEYVKSTFEVLNAMSKQNEDYNFSSIFGNGGGTRGL